jgi:acyl-CoA thioester hydrolase
MNGLVVNFRINAYRSVIMQEKGIEIFEMKIDITEDDIDELGHVNNVVYLRWVQDIAVAHWRHSATPDQQARYVWVVVRHEIDYKHPARLGNSILARTWVGPASKHTFERNTEIMRSQDGILLSRARTLWCPLDVKTGRPVLVDQDVRERFSIGVS